MKVKEWAYYGDVAKLNHVAGGMGGFFNWDQKGMRWKDYLDNMPVEEHPYLEALRESILENKIRFGGDAHQNHPEGTPIFEDGTTATFSYRAWGDLLAAVWSEYENVDYHYMDFYMGVNNFPEQQKPSNDEEANERSNKTEGDQAN